MPVVYVHGVANRWGADRARGDRDLEALFRSVSLPLAWPNVAKTMEIFKPFWGALGGNPSSGGSFATLPTSAGYETFGTTPAFPELLTRDLVQVIAMQPDQPLLTTARQVSLPCAIDLLWACAVEANMEARTLENMGKYIAEALDYAERQPSPRWLAEVINDFDLVVKLKMEVESNRPTSANQEQFGVGDWWGYLLAGASAVRDYAQRSLIGLPRRAGSQAALYFLRPWMTNVGAKTVGDALVYLARRGTYATPGPIITHVLNDVREALTKRTPQDPLVLIGHSLGGVILFDLLSHFAPDVECDLLVTVGSQVGFFEELKLLADSSPTTAPGNRISRPGNVPRWLNVFDSVDVLAFTAQPVFMGVEDLMFSNETGAVTAHTSYLGSPRFHRRLGDRMRENTR